MTKVKKGGKCFSSIWQQVAKTVSSKVLKETPPKEKARERIVKELFALRENLQINSEN